MVLNVIVLKVDVSCEKCKQEVISIVSDIRGVNKIDVDSEKDVVTVIGEVDPHAIMLRLRKAKKKVRYVSVGPVPLEETQLPPDQPPTEVTNLDDRSPSCSCQNCVSFCDPVPMVTMNFQDSAPTPLCSIM